MCFCLPVLFVPIVLVVLNLTLTSGTRLAVALHRSAYWSCGRHGLFHQSSRDCLFGHFIFPRVPILFGLSNQHVWTCWHLVNLDFCVMLNCLFGHFVFISHSFDLNCLVDGTHDPYQHFKQCCLLRLGCYAVSVRIVYVFVILLSCLFCLDVFFFFVQ